jgi:hypothetical protein
MTMWSAHQSGPPSLASVLATGALWGWYRIHRFIWSTTDTEGRLSAAEQHAIEQAIAREEIARRSTP